MIINNQPSLPYNGHSGHVTKSDTSTNRALTNDADGTTNKNQAFCLQQLFMAGTDGMTWFEIDASGFAHHGITSGALSALHITGEVFMLKAKRNKSHIYCHSRYRNAFTELSRIDRPVKELKNLYELNWFLATKNYQENATRENEIIMLDWFSKYEGER